MGVRLCLVSLFLMATAPPAQRPAKPAKPSKPARLASEDDASVYLDRASKTNFENDALASPKLTSVASPRNDPAPLSPKIGPVSATASFTLPTMPSSPSMKPAHPPSMRRAPSETGSLDGDVSEPDTPSVADDSGKSPAKAKSPGKGGGKLAKMLGETNVKFEDEGKKMRLGYEIPPVLETRLQDATAVAEYDIFSLLAEHEMIGRPSATGKLDRMLSGAKGAAGSGGGSDSVLHLRVGFKQIITGADDQIVIYAALFCNEEKKYLTNDFIFTPSISKAGLTAGTQELDCLFTDIKSEELSHDLKLVVRVYRRGSDDESKGDEGVVQFQRPLGCAVLNLDPTVHLLLKKTTLFMKNLEPAVIYESPKNEKEFLNLHNLIIAKVKNPKEITKELPRSQILCEIGIFAKSLEFAPSEITDFLSLVQVPPLSIAELKPGEERHVLLLNLLSAEVQPSFKNVGVRINVRNSRREHVPGCVSRGLTMSTGKTGTFKSCVYYNTNTPVWNERLTIHLPRKLQTLGDWHLYIELIQESAKEHVVFSFAFLPIIQGDGHAIIKNQVHTLQGYKYSRKHPEVMDTYLNYTAAQKQQRQTPDKLLIESTVLSTVICDDPDLYRLINWYAIALDDIQNALDRCVSKPPTTLISVHKALLDSFFEMLAAKKIQSAQPILPSEGTITDYTIFTCEDAVLSACAFLLGYLTSARATENLGGEITDSSSATDPTSALTRVISLAEIKSGTKRDLLSDTSMKVTLPKGGIAAAAAEKQAAQDAQQANEQKTKALEKKKHELGNKWKEVINYYVDYFSTPGAHKPLMFYINSAFTWSLSAHACTLSASALHTHPRIASTSRLVEGFEYVWRLIVNSAKGDLSKSKAAGKLDHKAFKDRLLAVLDTMGRFLGGVRVLEEGVNATGAFLEWLGNQRTILIAALPAIVVRIQSVLVPLGVLSETELCKVVLEMLANLPAIREENIQNRILSTFRVLLRDGFGKRGTIWFQPMLRQCFALVKGVFDAGQEPIRQAQCVPLLGDMIRVLRGEEFPPLTPNVPPNWLVEKGEIDPTFIEEMTQDLGALLPELVTVIEKTKQWEGAAAVMEGEFLGPHHPKQELVILKETVTTFIGLIELVWTPARIAQMEEYFFAGDGPCIIADMLQVLNYLLSSSVYSRYWAVLRVKEVNAAVHVLETSFIHIRGMAKSSENRAAAVQAWLLLALNSVMDPVVNPDLIKEEAKRELLSKVVFDYRDAVAGNILALSTRTMDLHLSLIPALIDTIFRVALNKRPSVNNIGLALFRQFIGSEIKANNSMELMLSASIDVTAKLVSEYAKKQQLKEVEQGLRNFFATALVPYADREEAKTFEERIVQLLSQLTTLEDMQRKPQFEDERAAAACKLIQVSKDTGKAKVLQTYLEFLHELHTSLGNSVESANVLFYEQSLLSWNSVQRPRKISLLERAIATYAEVQWWERSIESCKVLQEGYSEWLLLEPSSALLRQQASFQDQIVSKERIFPAYYRVALFGNGFGPQKGQEFVYRSGNGANLEGVRDFTMRMQEKFKGATMINSSDVIPEEKTAPADARLVQITTLVPSSREEMANKPHNKDHLRGIVSPRILAYYNQCETDVFTYTRVHSQNKDKNANEFKDLWLAKTYLITEEVLPGMKRCAAVIDRLIVLRPPIESAVVNIVTKNRELEDLIWKMQNADLTEAKKMHGPLSMNLSGVIDAAVMGGVDKYREAFFTGSYLEANPEHKEFVAQFAVAMEHQLVILDKGLKLFTAQCDETLKPLTLHLQTTLQKMNVSVRRDIISHGVARHHKAKSQSEN